MLVCPTCGKENDDLAVVCTSCKGYVQSKVDTLDLFGTIWGLAEKPVRTMHRIAIARHKNYGIALSAPFGIAVMFGILWALRWGARPGGLGEVFLIGLVGGPPFGVLAVFLIAWIYRLFSRPLGGHATTREAFAVVAYSTVPVVLSLFLVMPIEFALFGQYLFDPNPSPMTINGRAYVALLVIDGLLAMCSLLLLVAGLRVALRLTVPRALFVVFGVPLALVAIVVGVMSRVSH